MALLVVTVFTWHLPAVLTSTLSAEYALTVRGSAASPPALELITGVGVVVLPGVIAYQAWSYWVFRRRVSADRVPA